jgi:hypothetical protein
MRHGLPFLLMALSIFVYPGVSRAFDYKACVQSGAGTNVERMGGAAWRKLNSLEQRKAICAQIDDESKALEQDRRRAQEQDQRSQDREQRGREQGRQAQEQDQQAQDRERRVRDEEQRAQERQQDQQERVLRYQQKQSECARSGACSTTADLLEQIRRSKQEFGSPAAARLFTDDKNRFVLLDEVKEPPARWQPEISFDALPGSSIRYVRLTAIGLNAPREVQIMCDRELRSISLTTTATENVRTTATYEAS